MAFLQILPITDKRLTEPSLKVLLEDGKLPPYIVPLARDMLDTSRAVNGAGMAAIQVGHPIQMFVMDLARMGGDTNAFINPEIIEQADYNVTRKEGCLSMPDIFFEVDRPAWVKLRYIDMDGATKEYLAEDFAALCVQHEMDHLNGVRHVDHVSPLKRKTLLKKHENNVRAQVQGRR